MRSSSDSGAARLPDFSFEFNPPSHLVDDTEAESPFSSSHTVFNHPNLNSSAPVLSAVNPAGGGSSSLATRAAPVRHISFAANLSIYDTFGPTIYDRRCEPVTCNRLTPALAQRIKEELNTYKMEEMEVHAASRVHTHFFV